MMKIADYKIEHWTTAAAEMDYQSQSPQVVKVDDRAATRRAIIQALKDKKINFIERSGWQAHKPVSKDMVADWSYLKIAIHHSGRESSCGSGTEKMHAIQDLHQHHKPDKWPDIGYHYAVDCWGNVLEGRDIRNKGSHMKDFNSAAIGIVLLLDLSEPEDAKDGPSIFLRVAKSVGLGRNGIVPKIQEENLRGLIETLRRFFNLVELGGHIEFKGQKDYGEGRLCPGVHGLQLVADLRAWSGLAKPI